MRLVLHPKVYSDIDEIMGYYERVATPGLAEEFYIELRYFMTKAADKPESFSIRTSGGGVEILNLSKRFGKMSKRWLCLADELTTARRSN
jgi:hypothetical protein